MYHEIDLVLRGKSGIKWYHGHMQLSVIFDLFFNFSRALVLLLNQFIAYQASTELPWAHGA